jgi:hypothetical protein
LAAFPKADQPGVLFAFDGCVYNPSGLEIPWALVEHENVHLRRQREISSPDQRTGAEVWWDRYLRDPEFRYHEELLAHAAEYRAQAVGDRNFCAGLLVRTALRLIAPLYAYEPPRTMAQAMKDLKQEIGR